MRLRFWKPSPNYKPPTHARLAAAPGSTLDLVDKSGVVVAKVVLQSISRSRAEGTTVLFEDFGKQRQRFTYFPPGA